MSFKRVTIGAIACSLFSLVAAQILTPLKSSINVEVRDNITLECQIAQPQVGTFIWFHNDNLLFYNTDDQAFNVRYKVARNDQSSRLTVTNIQSEDRGVWKCQVSVGQTKYDTKTILVIKSSPQWYNMTQQEITLRLGRTVDLYCGALGDPTPVVIWTRVKRGGMGIIRPNGKMSEFYIGSSLRLSNVTGMHIGTYNCHASNGIQPGISREFIVKVPSKPYVTVYASSVRAPRNRTFQIGCVAQSYPQITTLGSVSWFKGSTMLQNDANNYRYTISSNNKDGLTSISTLTTPKVDNSVTGMYRCQFTNNQGIGSQTIILKAGAATKPGVGASTSGAPSILAVLHLLVTSVLYAISSVEL